MAVESNPAGPARRRLPAWVGVVPFFTLAALFLIWPAYTVILETFVDPSGGWTLENLRQIFNSDFREAFATSFELSLVTAIIGGLVGTALAYALGRLERPRFLRSALTTFSSVAAQFGGVPLAFAFVATLGSAGMITKLLNGMGLDPYAAGFSLLNFWGLVIVYLYFQIPLMLIVVAPAVQGLRMEWEEAAAVHGASRSQYWRYVGVPLLTPPVIGGMALLFANSFAAYATAQVLTSGSVNLVPIQIGYFIQGNVVAGGEQVGFALAFGMIVVVTLSLAVNQLLLRRTARWMS